MATATIDTRRWTREEYERLVQQGFFHPEEKLELVDGVIYEMTPQSSFHSTGIRFAESALRPVFAAGFDIRTQMPLARIERKTSPLLDAQQIIKSRIIKHSLSPPPSGAKSRNRSSAVDT